MKAFTSTLLLAALTSLGTTGCEWVALGLALSEDDDSCDDGCCDDSDCCGDTGCLEPAPPPDPPTVTFTIPEWPPIGPNDTVTLNASSDGGLDATTFFFVNTFNKSFAGTQSVSALGHELGEGFGQLEVLVTSFDGSFTRRAVDGLLVDLTPPSAYFDETVLPATGKELQFWMGDAWIVSRCSLTIGDKVFTEEVDPGYPDTIGVEWDYSLVTIPVEELPVGSHTAHVEVWDAAGNVADLEVALTIDALAPEVGIPSPQEGEVLDGLFDVTVTATDDVPLPVAIEISIGGALVATGSSPQTTITFSTDDFPQGPTEISVVAVDEAGNRSAPVVRSVTLESAAE